MTQTNAGGLAWLAVVMALLFAGIARAQDQAWVQIEAQPTLAEAIERARAYTSVFPDVAGYALNSGWYGIVLGPYSSDDAAADADDTSCNDEHHHCPTGFDPSLSASQIVLGCTEAFHSVKHS